MYKVFKNGSVIGSATISKEGLYYYIRCSIWLTKQEFCRVLITDGINTFDLGICIPDGNAYSCVSRVPCKRLCGTDFKFTISNIEDRKSVPVESGKSFAHLDKLNAVHLHIANGQPVIMIDSSQDPLDSGQNPAHRNKWVQR